MPKTEILIAFCWGDSSYAISLWLLIDVAPLKSPAEQYGGEMKRTLQRRWTTDELMSTVVN